MVGCASELKTACRNELVKLLEDRLIDGAITHSKIHGDNVPFEMCVREHKGKKYRVFIPVKEVEE